MCMQINNFKENIILKINFKFFSLDLLYYFYKGYFLLTEFILVK